MNKKNHDIWTRFPNYTNDELNDLTAIAVQSMVDSEELPDDLPDDVGHISNLAAARWLSKELENNEFKVSPREIRSLLESPELSQGASLSFLAEAKKNPELSRRISEQYISRQAKMALPETLLLTGALVILAMKIKHIKWGNVRIEFESFNDSMASVLKKSLNNTSSDDNG